MVVYIFSEALQRQAHYTMQQAFAQGTRANMVSHFKKFQEFVLQVGEVPLPISVGDLKVYIQFLSNAFRAPQSARNYVNSLRVLHSMLGLPIQVFSHMEVRLMFKGVARLKQHRVRQALPVTPAILRAMAAQVDWRSRDQMICWAAVLLSFYAMLRSSNLVPKRTGGFDPLKQLCRRDIIWSRECFLICIRWSKTIQTAERKFFLPLLPMQDALLCPMKALAYALKKGSSSGDVIFQLRSGAPLTYTVMLHQFKSWLSLAGLQHKKFSLHSLRRGAATLAFAAHVPGELIKAHGDWSSDAYRKYLSISLEQRCEVAQALQTQIESGRPNLIGC